MAEYRICKRCDGDGWEDEYRGIECGACLGMGEIEVLTKAEFKARLSQAAST